MVSDLENKRIFIIYHCNETNDGITFNDMNVTYVLLNTAKPVHSVELRWAPTIYVINCEDSREYLTIIKFLYLTRYWNPRAVFIVSVLQDQNMSEYARTSWNYGISFLYLLTSNGKLFTYSLYSNGSCGNNTNLYEVSSISRRKPLLYFNNCPLRIMAAKILPYVIDPYDEINCGYEVTLIKEIAFHAKMVPVFINQTYPHWGQTKLNGSYSYMFRDLFEGNIDVVIGMVVAQSNWFGKDFDGTHIPGLEASHFYVPSAKPIDGWKNFTLVFSRTVWIALTVIIVFTSLAVYLVSKSSHKTVVYADLSKCIFITLRMSLSPQPAPTVCVYLRFILTLWCSSFLLINTAYQSQLISTLLKPAYEHQISSVEEVIHSSHLKYGGFDGLIEFFDAANEDIFKEIRKNWINCTLSTACLNRTAINRDFAVMKTVKTVTYYMQSMYRKPTGEFQIYKLDDYAFVYSISFALRRGSAYLVRFNSLIAALVENGLYNKWIDNIPSSLRKRHADQMVQLNLHHLKAAFLLLVAGYATATIIFLGEIKLKLKKEN